MITISVDDEEIIVLDDGLIKMMEYSFPKDKLKDIFINNILDIVNKKISEGQSNIQKDWIPKIRSRFNSMPTKDNEIAALIFSQPDYEDYDERNDGN